MKQPSTSAVILPHGGSTFDVFNFQLYFLVLSVVVMTITNGKEKAKKIGQTKKTKKKATTLNLLQKDLQPGYIFSVGTN